MEVEGDMGSLVEGRIFMHFQRARCITSGHKWIDSKVLTDVTSFCRMAILPHWCYSCVALFPVKPGHLLMSTSSAPCCKASMRMSQSTELKRVPSCGQTGYCAQQGNEHDFELAQWEVWKTILALIPAPDQSRVRHPNIRNVVTTILVPSFVSGLINPCCNGNFRLSLSLEQSLCGPRSWCIPRSSSLTSVIPSGNRQTWRSKWSNLSFLSHK